MDILYTVLTGEFLHSIHGPSAASPCAVQGRATGHWRNEMPISHWMEALAACMAFGLFVYLAYALLRPEKF
jgi:K+-transporting ATPase KdpF subunit